MNGLSSKLIGNNENGSWSLDIAPQNLTFTPEAGLVLCSIVHISSVVESPLETIEVWINPVEAGVQVGEPSVLVVTPVGKAHTRSRQCIKKFLQHRTGS